MNAKIVLRSYLGTEVRFKKKIQFKYKIVFSDVHVTVINL